MESKSNLADALNAENDKFRAKQQQHLEKRLEEAAAADVKIAGSQVDKTFVPAAFSSIPSKVRSKIGDGMPRFTQFLRMALV